MSLMSYLKKRLWDEEWNVAIRPHLEKGIFDNSKRYFVLKNTWRYWCADPFVVDWDGKSYVFMEIFDRCTQKGSIGYRIIDGGKVGPIKVCIDMPFHMSYPMIYIAGNDILMIPECHKSNQLTAYRAIRFPDKWEPVETILENRALCDTNYLSCGNDEFLLTMPLDNGRYIYDTLELYWRNSTGEWEKSDNNPFVIGPHRARNGGNFFSIEGKLYRPSQNCGNSYGEKININYIREISRTSYIEELVQEITIKDILLPDNRYDGIHTYNHSESYDVIDLRRQKKFQIAKAFYLIRHKLGIHNE